MKKKKHRKDGASLRDGLTFRCLWRLLLTCSTLAAGYVFFAEAAGGLGSLGGQSADVAAAAAPAGPVPALPSSTSGAALELVPYPEPGRLPHEGVSMARPGIKPAPEDAAAVRACRAHPWQEDPPWGWKPWPRPYVPAAASVQCKDCCNDGTSFVQCLDVDACADAGPKVGRYAFILSYINVPKEERFLPYLDSMKAVAEAAAPNKFDYILVMPKLDSRRLKPEQRAFLSTNGVKLAEVDWTLPPGMRFYREKKWCGPKDLVRLHALGFEGYDAVAYFDSDMQFWGDLTPVFRCAATGRLLTTNGLDGIPLNIGFFAVKPDRRLQRAAEFFARESEYNDSFGWAGSGFAPHTGHKFRTAECGQGFLHTLFYKRGSSMALRAWREVGLGEAGFIGAQVDRCLWNYQGDDCRAGFDCKLVRVHHKPSPKAVIEHPKRHVNACRKRDPA